MDRPDFIDPDVDPSIAVVDIEEEAMVVAVGCQPSPDDIERAKQMREAALQAIATRLIQQRDDAIRGRVSSGIEQTWLDDQEMYEGIDDANRAEEAWSRQVKPIHISINAAPIGAKKPDGRRSTVLLNIARPYTDNAAARVSDMLLPTDDRPWEFKPTPEADISEADRAQQQAQQQAQPVDGEALDAADKQRQSLARQFAERAQRKVDDWMTQCNWHGHVRQIIDDAARIGTGVIKGPTAVARRYRRWKTDANGMRRLVLDFKIEPQSEAISVWDCYPDPSCGENIHDGSHFHERMQWTEKMLSDLREEPPEAGWMVDQINACLEEGPRRFSMETANDFRNIVMVEASLFEVWNSYATLRREDLIAIGVDCADVHETTLVPIHAVICNNRVIKVTLNALDSGDYPYDFLTWSRREGMPYGRGICRQIRTPQRMITAAVRNLMDNAGLSAGIMLFLRRRGLMPADGDWSLHGRKVFYIDDETDADRAVKAVEVPSRQAELIGIIDFALRMAEDVTGLPLLLQGQQGQAPDTVGGMRLLNNNANATLRRLAKQFDTQVTEPHVTRYYEWLQQNVDDPQYHGDLNIDARGSSALIERDIQNQAIFMMAQYVNDPEFRVDKAKWFEEWCKSQRLDPKRFQYDNAEWEERQANAPPPPEDPRIVAARIREEGQTERQRAEIAARREAQIVELLAQEGLSTADIKTRLLEIITKDRRERDLFVGQRAVKQRYGESVDMPG